MKATLGIVIDDACWPDKEASRLNAALEAADTGSAVLKVHAIEIRSDSVLFVGTLPADALEVKAGSPAGMRTFIRPRSFGKLHRTYDGLKCSGDPIGFLVLHHPVKLTGGWVSEEAELVSVAVEVARCSGSSLLPGVIGPVCCGRCNEPIAEKRLKAIPGAKRCMKCQSLKGERTSD